jgi:hypothetical protein
MVFRVDGILGKCFSLPWRNKKRGSDNLPWPLLGKGGGTKIRVSEFFPPLSEGRPGGVGLFPPFGEGMKREVIKCPPLN